jgi:hypothetical protein
MDRRSRGGPRTSSSTVSLPWRHGHHFLNITLCIRHDGCLSYPPMHHRYGSTLVKQSNKEWHIARLPDDDPKGLEHVAIPVPINECYYKSTDLFVIVLCWWPHQELYPWLVFISLLSTTTFQILPIFPLPLHLPSLWPVFLVVDSELWSNVFPTSMSYFPVIYLPYLPQTVAALV